ncbi:MurR/RpiR family transcriptional regulator [Allomesorhizobium alhagi]|uniref:MurR/RpiR family transcriptional regulator n=1 Tax=Allomesorhizobium alhagi TaxID=475067 RepID=UPI001FCC8FD5|nr:hypothetical protein [Mesorhizobium alhagi]
MQGRRPSLDMGCSARRTTAPVSVVALCQIKIWLSASQVYVRKDGYVHLPSATVAAMMTISRCFVTRAPKAARSKIEFHLEFMSHSVPTVALPTFSSNWGEWGYSKMEKGPLADLLLERFENMPPQLRVAARFVLDHPKDVALMSMREQARQAGVSQNTMMRLARWLGLEGYQLPGYAQPLLAGAA